jgi:hypothetical protein
MNAVTDTRESEIGSEAGQASRPGPIYDRVMRGLVTRDLAAFAEWLKVPLEDDIEIISESFAAETLHTDLLARVSRDRLLHVEYVRAPVRDTAARMAGYRAQIMRRHPDKSIAQYAIVLGEGWLRSCDDPINGFSLGLKSVYVRECDPAVLLSNSYRAPLAVLAKGDQDSRAKALSAALAMADKEPDRQMLIDAALTLATITLDRSTLDRVREETGMTIETVADFYSETEVGRELLGRGREAGRDEGREEGREEGHEDVLTALLKNRFGEQARTGEVAQRLAHFMDLATAVDVITKADSLDELLR